MIVDIFIPCYIDQFYPNTGMNMVKVLEQVGCGVNYNTDQTCCGLPAFHEGFRDHCKDIGEKLICEFQNDRYIVSPGGACVNMVRNYYPEIFHNSSMHNEYKQVQKHFYEFSDFLVNVLNVKDVGVRLVGTAVFMDHCSTMREGKVQDAPRTLLQKVKGLKLLEPPGPTTCCGWGNTFASKYEDVAVRLAEEKLEQIYQLDADFVISTDMGCLMHLEGVMKMKGEKRVRVVHIADVLAGGVV